jgi:hypothetical protein
MAQIAKESGGQTVYRLSQRFVAPEANRASRL